MRTANLTITPAVDLFIQANGSRIFKTEREEAPACSWLELVPDLNSAAPDDENRWPEMEA